MKSRAFCLAIALASGVGLAHENDFPLPLLAQGTIVPETGAAATTVRPRQQPGQTLPLRSTRRIAFETDEGTWMSVDRSPDGSR